MMIGLKAANDTSKQKSTNQIDSNGQNKCDSRKTEKNQRKAHKESFEYDSEELLSEEEDNEVNQNCAQSPLLKKYFFFL
jgi:hypothetical protein